jgi:hypothetical protein
VKKYTLTIIHIILCLLAVFILNRCSYKILDTASPEYNLKHHPTYNNTPYSLLDYKGVLHKYRVDLKSKSFPQDNRELTQYCGIHFHWEDIKAVYGKVGKDFTWTYYVNQNKKSFKMRKI